LLVFSLKIFKKFIKAWVTFSHAFDAGIKTFSWLLSLCLDKVLKFFDFLNGFGTTGTDLALNSPFVPKKQHLLFLVLVLVAIMHDL